MGTILFFVGIITIIAGVVGGFIAGTAGGVVLGLVTGIVASLIYFALAKILENQDAILYELRNTRQQNNIQKTKKTCEKCGKEHDVDVKSCPHCGYRP